jgi:lipoate-protein ligase B
MTSLHICHLGPTGYAEGLALQEALVRARAAGQTGDWVLFPDHPPVLTVGRNPSDGALIASSETLAGRGIEVFEVARGGDITWHGPGQLVGYPIFDLDARDRDLHRFLRGIEEVLIRTLATYHVAAERSPGRTGVWVEGRKVASIGIAVRRWVSYHGFALNVHPDLADFDLIHPCGLRGIRMTSLAVLKGSQAPGLAEVRQQVAKDLADVFDFDEIVQVPADDVRSRIRESAVRESAA